MILEKQVQLFAPSEAGYPHSLSTALLTALPPRPQAAPVPAHRGWGHLPSRLNPRGAADFAGAKPAPGDSDRPCQQRLAKEVTTPAPLWAPERIRKANGERHFEALLGWGATPTPAGGGRPRRAWRETAGSWAHLRDGALSVGTAEEPAQPARSPGRALGRQRPRTERRRGRCPAPEAARAGPSGRARPRAPGAGPGAREGWGLVSFDWNKTHA